MAIYSTANTGELSGLDINVISQDSSQVVSVDTVKSFIRVDFPDDDMLIGMMIESAIDWIERYCAISLRTKVITATFDSISSSFEVPYGPVQSVTGFTDYLGNTIPTTSYLLTTALYPQLQYKGYTSGQVTLNYTTGYLAGQVPQAIVHAICMLVSTDYDNRANYTVARAALIEASNDVKSKVNPYRRKVMF